MKWARWLVDHPTTVLVAVIAMLIFGISAYATLPRESTPDITIPVVVVTTPYIGVSPEDIETLVTIPMERQLKDLKDVDKMTSTSYEGASSVILEFNPDKDVDDALQKVREKVDAAENDLPEDAEDAIVSEISFSDIPVLIVSMTGPQDEEELKGLADDLADDLEAIPGVLDVKVSGGLTREIQVLADPDRMTLYDVSFNDILFAMRNENVNVPGGNVDADAVNYLLRIPGEFEEAGDIAEVPIKNVGGQTVFVRDVARVVDGYADRATYARMNGTPSISLSIQKRVGENIIEVADESRIVVEAAAADWPEGVEHAFLADQSREINAMVGELENNILSGLILVVGVLLFFMGFRNSWFVGLAIPGSMLVSFMVLQALGITLNMVVLFSLILALGMLVDNAIVIVENIYRHVELGKTLKEASIVGVSEVAIPVTTSTLTTVLAFAPMLVWTGIMGEFMGYLPKTLIIVLSSSLLVALVIIPTATSRWMKAQTVAVDLSDGDVPTEGLYGKFLGIYKKVLEWSIDHRYLSFFGVGIPSLIGTFVIYGVFNHGTEFFPQTEPARAIVQVTAPHGTEIEVTDKISRQLEMVLDTEADVDTYITEVGVAAGGDGFGFGSSSVPHSARITVDFKPTAGKAREGEEIREGSSFDAIERVRQTATEVVGANVLVDKIQEGPPVGLPISIEIKGDDQEVLGEAAADVKRQLAGIEGVVDISDDYKVGRPELRFDVDRAAAKRVGANTVGVANTIRTAVAGSKASVLRQGDEEYDIIVSLDERYTQDIPSILALRVPGKDNVMVPLSTLASVETRGGSGSIKHKDQETVVTITADVADGYRVDLLQAEAAELMANYDAPEGVRLGAGGANEEEAKAAAFLLRSFGIALALIFMVLVTQFDSVTRPFIIMMSVMLSLIGVLWGLLLTGTPFGIMMTGVGVISLAGVVVNNAIVLLDYVQVMRERGNDVRTALVNAGLVRFRPVILTAITTVLGLFPMATGISFDFRKFSLIVGGDSAQFWGPMAVAVSFGLIVATILTLVMVPTMYSITEDIVNLIRRIFGLDKKKVVAAAAASSVVVLLALVPGVANAQTVTLDDALSAAQQNNLDLKILAENQVQANAQMGQALSTLSPKLSTGGNYTYNKDEIAFTMDITESIPDEFAEFFEDVEPTEPTIIQKQQYWDANVSVIQPLFNAPALPLLRGAKAQKASVGLSIEHQTALVELSVTQSYYMLVVSRDGYGLALDAVDNSKAHLDLAQKQVSVGAAPPLAAMQAEVAVYQAERTLADAKVQLEQAEEQFALVTGLSRDSQVQMPPMPTVVIGSLDEGLDAVGTRSDIQASQLQADMARYQQRADQLGWLPKVDGRFTYSWTENTGFSGDPEWWMVTVGATWMPWDGGYRLNTNKQYASQARQADFMRQKTELEASQEVRVAWESWQKAETSYALVERQLALAEESLVLATRGFKAGANSWLEVQDAELMVNQAKLGMLSERMARDLAAAQLEVAVGAY
ncbi:MAG: TolC family protein [Proteobacteria bacterium]|nr:TolC family protein [Pseudomonadota bacterium]MCP4920836.1 TolC family protein [Pseudomonadota bacterium]